MKILVIGKKNQLCWVDNCVDALNNMGLNVKKLYVNEQGKYNDFKRNIIKTFSKDASINFTINLLDKEIKKFKPNLIIAISPFLLPLEYSKLLASFRDIIKIAWIGDKFGPIHKEYADCYDKIYFTDSYFVNLAKNYSFPKSSYLPLAFNEKIFYDNNLLKNDKLLFIGSKTEERKNLINLIDYPKVRLVGNRWKGSINESVEIIDKSISIFDVAKEYNQTNFILNLKNEDNVINGLNMRSFEAPACGSILFQDYVKDIEINFEPNKEIIVYRSIDEIPFQIDRLLKDKKLLENISENAKYRVFSEHKYEHRIKKILDDLNIKFKGKI